VKIQAHTYGDLFYVVCGVCLTKTHNEFTGMGQLLTYCPTCRQAAAWSIDEFCWSGIAGRPSPDRRELHELKEASVHLNAAPDYSLNAEAGHAGDNRRAA
jgi:hypothetical protein